jgi:hypothetical protein
MTSAGFQLSYIVCWCLVLFLSLVSLAVLQRVNELRAAFRHRRSAGPNALPSAVGSEAANFIGYDLQTQARIELRSLNSELKVIIFASVSCGTCQGLIRFITGMQFPEGVSFIVVCSGEERECRSFVGQIGLRSWVLPDEDGEIGSLYRLSQVPSVFVVSATNTVLARFTPESAVHFRDEIVKHSSYSRQLEFESR